MAAAGGCGDGHARLIVLPSLLQASHEIGRKKGRVGGNGNQPVMPVSGSVIEASKDAGKRAGMIGSVVGQNQEAERREAGRVAVGAEDESGDLRGEAGTDVGQHRLSDQQPQSFITTSHPT